MFLLGICVAVVIVISQALLAIAVYCIVNITAIWAIRMADQELLNMLKEASRFTPPREI
jgi:hypothetical protein